MRVENERGATQARAGKVGTAWALAWTCKTEGQKQTVTAGVRTLAAPITYS
jgi:hypothetical protein